MKATTDCIKDVIGKRYYHEIYLEQDGHPEFDVVIPSSEMDDSETFDSLPDRAKVEPLIRDVDWEGFTEAQQESVIRRVLDGQGPESWMNGIAPPPTREAVEGQIGRLKAGTEWITIAGLDIARDEMLGGRSWGDLTEGQKLEQLRLGTDVMLLDPQERRELLAREVDFARIGPTEQQIEATIDRIKEVISIPYLEGEEYDVDEPPPRSGLEPIPFYALTRGDRIEILDMLVDWEGFTDAQSGRVIRHVIEGLGPESWMDGIEPERGAGRSVDRLIADFHARVEEMKRDGVPDYPPLGGRLPWAEATEERKLQNIVWESMSVWLEGNRDRFQTIDVPGAVRLEAVERNVDYDKLPEDWRNALKSLRAETGQADDRHIAAELQRITGLEYDDDEPDGAPMHEKPVPAETAPRLRMNQAPDCYTGLMTELEAFADRFESLARTPEQEALAKGFGEFVAGQAHATLRYLTAEALRPDPAPADFDRLMAESAAVAPDPPDPDRGIDP